MDPNVTLAGIRAITENYQGEFAEGKGDELVQLVTDLDEWLCKGGFRPQAWYLSPIPGAEMPDARARAQAAGHAEQAWYVFRDGKAVSGAMADEDACHSWLLHHQGMSTDWALKYEGYSISQGAVVPA